MLFTDVLDTLVCARLVTIDERSVEFALYIFLWKKWQKDHFFYDSFMTLNNHADT